MTCKYLNNCNLEKSEMDCDSSTKIGEIDLISFCMGEGKCGRMYEFMKTEEFEYEDEPVFGEPHYINQGRILI